MLAAKSCSHLVSSPVVPSWYSRPNSFHRHPMEKPLIAPIFRLSLDVLAEICSFLPSQLLLDLIHLGGNAEISRLLFTTITSISLRRDGNPRRLVEIPTFCFANFCNLKSLHLSRQHLPSTTIYHFLTSLPSSLTDLNIECDNSLDMWSIPAKLLPSHDMDSRFAPSWFHGPTLITLDRLLPHLRSLTLFGTFFTRYGERMLWHLPVVLERLVLPAMLIKGDFPVPSTLSYLQCSSLQLNDSNVALWDGLSVLVVHDVSSASPLPRRLSQLVVFDASDTFDSFLAVSTLEGLKELRLQSNCALAHELVSFGLPSSLTSLSLRVTAASYVFNIANFLPQGLTSLKLKEPEDSAIPQGISSFFAWPVSLTHLTLLAVIDSYVDPNRFRRDYIDRLPLLPPSVKSVVFSCGANVFFALPISTRVREYSASNPSHRLTSFSGNPHSGEITSMTIEQVGDSNDFVNCLPTTITQLVLEFPVREAVIMKLPMHIKDIRCSRILMSGEAVRRNPNITTFSLPSIIDGLVAHMRGRLNVEGKKNPTNFEWDSEIGNAADVRRMKTTTLSATSSITPDSFPQIRRIIWKNAIPTIEWFNRCFPNMEQIDYLAPSSDASFFPVNNITHLSIYPTKGVGLKLSIWDEISALKLTFLELLTDSWPADVALPSSLTHLSVGNIPSRCEVSHLTSLASLHLKRITESFVKLSKFPKTLEKLTLLPLKPVSFSFDPKLLPPHLKTLCLKHLTASMVTEMPSSLILLNTEYLHFDESFAVDCLSRSPVSETCDLDSYDWIVKWLRQSNSKLVLRASSIVPPTGFGCDLPLSAACALPPLVSLCMRTHSNSLVKVLPLLPKSITCLEMRLDLSNKDLFSSHISPHLLSLNLRELVLKGDGLSKEDVSRLPSSLTRLKTRISIDETSDVPFSFPPALAWLSLSISDPQFTSTHVLAELPRNLKVLKIVNAGPAISEDPHFWTHLPSALQCLVVKHRQAYPAYVMTIIEGR